MLTTPPAPTTERARHAGRFAPTLDHVWLAVALALLALRPLLTPIPPNDFWWHLATGRAIVAQGQIPVVDSFSYTRFGQPFFNQGWLAQLFMYGLHQLGGVPLIIITQALVIALAYWLLLRLCIRRSGSVRLSVALLLLATVPLSFSNWIVRPQSYALPIFAGFLTILTEYRLGMSRRLWLLPPLMALWVNLHGTFVLGLWMADLPNSPLKLRSWFLTLPGVTSRKHQDGDPARRGTGEIVRPVCAVDRGLRRERFGRSESPLSHV